MTRRALIPLFWVFLVSPAYAPPPSDDACTKDWGRVEDGRQPPPSFAGERRELATAETANRAYGPPSQAVARGPETDPEAFPREAATAKGYEVVGDISSGWEGRTVRARKGGADKALKVSADRRGPLRQEAVLVNQVRQRFPDSPYFLEARIVELKDDGSLPALETPFFPRRPGSDEPALTLWEWMARRELTPELKDKITVQLTEAVVQMHEAGVIHRDLKPSNVMVDDAGNVRIIDFGISSKDGDQPVGLPADRASGSPAYMSPGQWLRKPGSPADDLYALRRTLWQLYADDAEIEATVEVFRRDVASRQIPDYKVTPERFAPAPMAIAIWSRFPKTAREQLELVDAARKKKPSEFYSWYGKKLAALPKEEKLVPNTTSKQRVNYQAAREILASKELIKQFPDGLGLKRDDVDEIARGFFHLYYSTVDGRRDPAKVGLLDENPFLYWKEFRARLTELQNDWKAGPDHNLLMTVTIPEGATPP